ELRLNFFRLRPALTGRRAAHTAHARARRAPANDQPIRSLQMNAPAEKLAADVRVLAADVQELVKATAMESGEKLAAARSRVQAALAEASDTVVMQSRNAAQLTDQYVRENSWTAAGVSAAIGFVLGLLVSRR